LDLITDQLEIPQLYICSSFTGKQVNLLARIKKRHPDWMPFLMLMH